MQDLNAFLKSDKLGKGDDFAPHLRTQLALAKKMFRKNQMVEKMKAAVSESQRS
ncbi:hypothetical protein [Trinickia sp. Y13]|uniref:hypothetical protein n=1 Tax=Trinickia sp. Y13 TaxID=2917807 RepID=UPI002404E2ED|nr:hypothetical protein [Trinickia sp. Y13]MDG0026642.1 hypothetical protein [Trinickia sp. Y13]